MCQTVYHLSARLSDGKRVRLVADIDREEAVIYLEALLTEQLGLESMQDAV